MVKVEQRIRIRLRGFDYRVLDQSVAEIVETVRRSGAMRRGGTTKVISLNELRDASSSLVQVLGLSRTAEELRRTDKLDEAMKYAR